MAKRKILLAEDDATMVSLLKTLLSMEGYQVVVLANEVNILDEIRAHQPDVLILDLHLFDLNGLDILADIRKTSDIAGLRVIMSSGSNVKEECLKRGAQGFLMKPYMPDDLFKLLKKVIAS